MFNISAQTLLQNAISEIGIFSDRKFKLLEWILALGQDDACVMLMFFRNILNTIYLQFRNNLSLWRTGGWSRSIESVQLEAEQS